MIAAWNERGKVMASYRKNGVLDIRAIGVAEYAGFARDPNALIEDSSIIDRSPDFPGWTKLLFLDYDSRKRALENNPGILYEADVSPVRRFMADHKCLIDPPRRAYLDLETNSRVPFSRAILGDTRLLSFAVVDENDDRNAFALDADNDQAEAELWAELWRILGDYDQIAAWNGDRFDFTVKKERCLILAKMFPDIMEPFWEHFRRLLFIDQLACFKRHHMAAESGDDKTSFALDAVCEALIGEGKSDFDSSKTWEAWAAGGAERQRLVDYNVQDTVLLGKLEKETGYLELQQTIAELTFTFANSHGLKPMPQVDGYMLRMAHEEKTHLPSKKPPTGAEKQYEGAFVFKPEALGVHREVHVCDFKSLYPTVIRTFNISPETKGRGLAPSKAFRTNIEFDNAAEGMLPRACSAAMNLREHFKKQFKANPNDYVAERKSKAYKIFNNSMYGVIGSMFSRYYDPELAESITLSAKHLNEVTADAARARGWRVIYMDTDSLFVQGCSVDEFKEFVKWCNDELYPRLLDEQGCPREQQCISLDYEKCFDRLIFPLGKGGKPAAKRYIGSYKHYAFRPKNEPEIRGLEYMRGDSVRYARRLQKQAIDMLLSGADDAGKLHEWIKRQREVFFDAQIEADDIAKSASISMALDSYKVNAPHVRIAKQMAELGEDVSEGTRIGYIIADATVSPAKVIPLKEFDGRTFDRHAYWNKAIYPPTMRVLAGAFPNSPWNRWIAKRPKKVLLGQLAFFA